MPYALKDPSQLSPVSRASRLLLIQNSNTPFASPASLSWACASTQYHCPTWLASNRGVTPNWAPSQWRFAKSLYFVVRRFPLASVPDAGAIRSAPVWGGSPHRCPIIASAQLAVAQLIARLSL